MLQGWVELFKSQFKRKNEFVSADARRFSNDARTYEMLSGTGHQLNITSPDRVLSPTSRGGIMSPEPDSKQDYAGGARTYVNPVTSYSYPRPPSQHKDWDPRATHARPDVAYDMQTFKG